MPSHWDRVVLISLGLLLCCADAARGQTTCTLAQITSGGTNLSIRRLAIDGDGRRIVFSSRGNPLGSNPDGNQEIFLLDRSTGLKQLTVTTTGDAGQLAISADGHRIAFNASSNPLGTNGDGNAELFLYDDAVGLAQLTHTTVVTGAAELAINANGSKIAFESDADFVGHNADGSKEIFLFDTTAGFRQITDTEQSDVPTINASGSRIAFVSADTMLGNVTGNDQIFVFDQATGMKRVTAFTTPDLDQPLLDASGRRIAFMGTGNPLGTNADGNREIFLYDETSGLQQVTVTAGGDNILDPGGFSADGTRILFFADHSVLPSVNAILLYDVDIGFSTVATGSAGRFAMSADGQTVVFTSSEDPLATNPDKNLEIFVAHCPRVTPPAAVPTLTDTGIGALCLLLAAALLRAIRVSKPHA